MGWFSKSKTDKDSEIILNEFPSWSAINSTKLVAELKKEDLPDWTGILSNDEIKSKFINCLIGAHLFYLCLAPEGGYLSIFGEKIQEKLMHSLPDEAKKFFVLAFAFHEKKTQEIDNQHSSMEKLYGIKIDPLDADVAFIIEQEVCGPSEDFSGLISYLLPILNRLRISQLKWLGNTVKKWSVAK